MNKILKYIFISMVVSIFLGLTSCDDYEDVITGDAKTGGLLTATNSVPYKLGSTPSFDITLDIFQGPGIKEIKVYNSFTHNVDEETTISSNMVLMATLNVSSANNSGDIAKSLTLTYEDLIDGITLSGYTMPSDELLLQIGDFWTLNYYSVMEDGREVLNNSKTTVGVANFFAGTYNTRVTYRHPSFGTYPNNIYVDSNYKKDLVALNATTCETYMSTWTDTPMRITINPDNSLTVVWVDPPADTSLGDPYDATKVSRYDPATGIIYLYYNYMGSGGYRIFWEVFTPAS